MDMSSTRFCGSAGIHILLRAHKRSAEACSELRLVIPPDSAVLRVLNLTGADHFIPCFASLRR